MVSPGEGRSPATKSGKAKGRDSPAPLAQFVEIGRYGRRTSPAVSSFGSGCLLVPRGYESPFRPIGRTRRTSVQTMAGLCRRSPGITAISTPPIRTFEAPWQKTSGRPEPPKPLDVRQSGSPALRRPSAKTATSCGRLIGTYFVTPEARRVGSSCRKRSIACRASSIRPASA
jgi:hypothetical protein